MKRTSVESLEFRSLSFSYDDAEDIISDVDFKFPVGEALFLNGPMGTGKSTVMKILMGLLGPTRGEYLINGQVMNNLSHRSFDRYRLNMGFSFDIGGLISNKSLLENLLLPLDYHGYLDPKERLEYVQNSLLTFKLLDQAHIRPGNLANGARKAAGLLKAFILDPEMIILNDPTLGLNNEQVSELLRLILHHQNEKRLKHLIISSDDLNFTNQFKGLSVQVVNKKFVAQYEGKKKAS